MPSAIYSAVHLADNLSELEDNSFDLKMVQDQVSDCQSCREKDAEIRRLREKVDELQYIVPPPQVLEYLEKVTHGAKGAINTPSTSTPVILSPNQKLNGNVAQELCLTGSASHRGQVSHIFTTQYERNQQKNVELYNKNKTNGK